VARTGFYRSKERIIIAEAFFDRKPDVAENDRKELLALIKDAGDSRVLKTRLKGWESSSTGGSSSAWFGFKPPILSEGQALGIIDGAVRQSRETSDHEFLTALPNKLSKEPLLEQLAQDVIVEVHGHFQEFLEHRLPHLYSHIHNIQQKAMYRQVELETNEQKQKGKASSRSNWFNEIKMAQGQVNPGYVSSCPHVCPTYQGICSRSQAVIFIHSIEEVKQTYTWGPSRSSRCPYFLILLTYALLSPIAFKLVAEVTRHTDALLEYKVHSLSLTSDSRQDLQLDPHSIPSIHIEPRHSYRFHLPGHHTIL